MEVIDSPVFISKKDYFLEMCFSHMEKDLIKKRNVKTFIIFEIVYLLYPEKDMLFVFCKYI